MINFVEQIAEDGLLAKRKLNTLLFYLLFSKFNSSEMFERISGVYKIQSRIKPDRIYIGSSVNIYHRWETHKSDLNKQKHSSRKLQNHVNKYGYNDLIYSIILICQEDDLNPQDGVVWIEQCFIWAYHYEGNKIPYFNISPTAGSSKGIKASAETRKKQSVSAKNKPPTSKETREKMSISQSKRTMPIEVRQKLSIKKKGIPPTRSVIEAARQANLGREHSKEQIEKCKKTKEANGTTGKGKPGHMLGKHHKQESKDKIKVKITRLWTKRKENGYISPLKGKYKYPKEEREERRRLSKLKYKKKIKLMSQLHINNLTPSELMRAEIPMNHVLVETEVTWYNKKSKGGIIVGFDEDVTFVGDESHVADLTIPYGIVRKIPKSLFFDKNSSDTMDWETTIEIQEGDVVWFCLIESRNAVCVMCENKLYRSIPYQDCYVAKRELDDLTDCPAMKGLDISKIGKTITSDELLQMETICLNGIVLCTPCYLPRLSTLDVTSEDTIDRTRGVIAFAGNPVKEYLREQYCDIPDLKVGDEVVFQPNTPLILLERTKELAKFSGNELFWVINRRRIIFVNNK